MAHIHHKGVPVSTSGQLPAIGSAAPDFLLTKTDLSDVKLKDFAGKIKVLNITPSLDTGTCATSAKKFNEQVASHHEVVVLNVSDDLPFAAKRFCDENHIDKVITLSAPPTVCATSTDRWPEFFPELLSLSTRTTKLSTPSRFPTAATNPTMPPSGKRWPNPQLSARLGIGRGPKRRAPFLSY